MVAVGVGNLPSESVVGLPSLVATVVTLGIVLAGSGSDGSLRSSTLFLISLPSAVLLSSSIDEDIDIDSEILRPLDADVFDETSSRS